MARQIYHQNVDVSGKHIEDWLLQNNLKFDEILSAQFALNKLIETNELELIDIRLFGHNIDNGLTINCDISSGLMIVSGCGLHGYFRAANPRKPKVYIILRCTDPAPIQYETAFYLRDAYQPIKNYVQTYPLISKINEAYEKQITYNLQWVIYKICV